MSLEKTSQVGWSLRLWISATESRAMKTLVEFVSIDISTVYHSDYSDIVFISDGATTIRLVFKQHQLPGAFVEILNNLFDSSNDADATNGDAKKGFHKVLGKGTKPTQPLIVKCRSFAKEAEKKIRAAGGCCVLVACTANSLLPVVLLHCPLSSSTPPT